MTCNPTVQILPCTLPWEPAWNKCQQESICCWTNKSLIRLLLIRVWTHHNQSTPGYKNYQNKCTHTSIWSHFCVVCPFLQLSVHSLLQCRGLLLQNDLTDRAGSCSRLSCTWPQAVRLWSSLRRQWKEIHCLPTWIISVWVPAVIKTTGRYSRYHCHCSTEDTHSE